jgi:hypothetical protein
MRDNMKKLYRVDVEFSYYVLAESEEDAEKEADLAINDSSPRIYASVADPNGSIAEGRFAEGWDSDSLVYGTQEEITLGAWIAKMREP